MAVKTGANTVVVSSALTLTLDSPLTSVVSPVLFNPKPLNNLAIPPVPILNVGVGELEILMSPPVSEPIETLFPALIIIAFEVVFDVEIFWAMVRSPARVSTSTVPLECTPLFVPTVPMVNPPLASVKLNEPSLVLLSPPARVITLLPVLFSVKVPVPCKPRLLAIMAAVWVTAPEACRLIVLFVDVSAAPMVMAAP